MLKQSERGGDHIDAAIDAAARSLTTGEPSAALRAGVRQRIGERSLVPFAFPGGLKPGTSEGGRRKAGWWLVPAGATAAVIAVMLVGRTLLDPRGGPAVGRTLSGPPARPADVRLSVDRATTQSVSRTGRPDVERTLSGLSGGPDKASPTVAPPEPLAAATLELPFEELEPLIPPITIEPLENRLIVVDTSSGVMPIEIEPLQIEPLRGD